MRKPTAVAAFALLTILVAACGTATREPTSTSQPPSTTATPPPQTSSTATWPALDCPEGFVQDSPSSCRDMRSPTPTLACPTGSKPVGFGCQYFTSTVTPTPAISPTPTATPDLSACRNLNLPAQYWLMPNDKVAAFLDTLVGRCIIFAYEARVIGAPISFSGEVALFEKAGGVRLELDAPPTDYSAVWGMVSKPIPDAPLYEVQVLRLLKLPQGEAPFRDGTFVVSAEYGIAPGPWKTAAHNGTSDDGCYWERDNANGEIDDNHFGSASTHTTLYEGESFQSEDCGPWYHVGFSTTGAPVTFTSAAEANDPCHNHYDADGSCHSDDSTWAACLAAGECYEKYK